MESIESRTAVSVRPQIKNITSRTALDKAFSVHNGSMQQPLGDAYNKTTMI